MNRENVKRSVFSFSLSLGQIVTYVPRFPGVVSLQSGSLTTKPLGFIGCRVRGFLLNFGVLALNYVLQFI